MPVQSKKQLLVGFIIWIAVCFVAAAIGGAASVQAKSFYMQLEQPDWAPPAWIFGPVWTLLYTLMGIAAWLVWRSGGFRENMTALILFLVQLVFNALWSWLFFVWHSGALSVKDILVLWILIVVTLVMFWRVNRLAGALLLPYLFWVTFAAALNFTVWQLNPQVLG